LHKQRRRAGHLASGGGTAGQRRPGDHDTLQKQELFKAV